jgi:hypothetical protein
MKTTKKVLSIGVAIVLIAFVLFLVFSAAGPAFSATLSALLAPTSTPPPGEYIPLRPIAGLTSLNATVTINVNGLINGKRVQGDLNGEVTTNDQKKSKVTVTGSLLGEIAAQVGGSVVGLFTPSSVDIYKVPEGAYIVANSLIPVCVKPKGGQTPETLDDLSPQSLMTMLTSSDVARGKLVGEETLNGMAVKHYVLNGDAFLAAAKKSSNPKLKAFGEALWSAEDADLYVDAKGGYPVAFNGRFSGAYDPLKFEGDFDVQVQLTGVNTNPPVNLPAACNKPITP